MTKWTSFTTTPCKCRGGNRELHLASWGNLALCDLRSSLERTICNLALLTSPNDQVMRGFRRIQARLTGHNLLLCNMNAKVISRLLHLVNNVPPGCASPQAAIHLRVVVDVVQARLVGPGVRDGIVAHDHARRLDETGFNGVVQAKVADDPAEEGFIALFLPDGVKGVAEKS